MKDQHQLPAKLAALEALDPDGGSVQLGTLWQEQTAVLAFVRHFG